MSTEVHIVRSFVKEGSGGNRAGVVIDSAALLNENQMSSIAKDVGASETAFARGIEHTRGSLEALFFKANGEPIPLCGHALIGALAVLTRQRMLRIGEHVIQTPSGAVRGRVEQNGVVWYSQNPSDVVDDPIACNDVVKAFSHLPAHAIGSSTLQPQIVQTVPPTNLRDMLVPVASTDYLYALQAEKEALEELCCRYAIDGVHLFVDTHVRNFSLGMTPDGAGEDAATGTLAGALACYLHTRQALREELGDILFLQGSPGHFSELRVRLISEGNTVGRVEVGGRVQQTGTRFIS